MHSMSNVSAPNQTDHPVSPQTDSAEFMSNGRIVALVFIATLLLTLNDRPTTLFAAAFFLLLPLGAYQKFENGVSWNRPLLVFLIVNGLLLVNFLVFSAPVSEFLVSWLKVAALVSLVPISYGLGQRIMLESQQGVFLKAAVLGLCTLVGLSMAAKSYLPSVEALAWWPEPWERNRASVVFSMALGVIYIDTAFSLIRRFALDTRWLWIGLVVVVSLFLGFTTESETAKLVLILAMAYPALHLVLRRFFRFAPALLFFMVTLVCVFAVDQIQQYYIEHGDRLLAGTVGARLDVWHDATRFMFENNFAPFGVDALKNNSAVVAAGPVSYANGPTSHPHNAGLQVLLDLGIVGFLIVGALLLYVGYKLENQPPEIHFLVIAAISIGIVSHGAWQSWWWLALALVGFYCGFRKGRLQRLQLGADRS